MTNTLDAEPEIAADIAGWREGGVIVPVMMPIAASATAEWSGSRAVLIGIPAKRLNALPLPDPLTAEAFIVGMEVLGFRFGLSEMDGRPALWRTEPDHLPEAWDRYAMRLLAVFHERKITAEAIAFLRDRGGN